MQNQLEVMLPKGYEDNDVLVRVKPKKDNVQQPSKFRSFCITCQSGIVIKGKLFSVSTIFDILKKHGVESTLPMCVSLGPTKFTTFDWNPHAYIGKMVHYFDWKGIKCSITGNRSTHDAKIYIRVHDMEEGVGERVLDELSDEIYETWVNPTPDNKFIIYTTSLAMNGFQWQQIGTRLHRELDTIYINDDMKDKLVHQLKKFYDSSALYDKYGVTWKRVHLFHGIPGTGKTSMVMALASIYGKNIAKLTLTPEVNSQHVEMLFQRVPENTFLLLEDVDSLFADRDAKSGIDFSTLLNCMDGLVTKRGLVVFMTTNHIEKLDAAFIRPGRVDMCMKFGSPQHHEQKAALMTLAADFEHEHDKFLNINSGMTIAAIQAHVFDRVMGEKNTIL